MSKWLVTRRALIVSTCASLVAGIPAFGAVVPLVKLAQTPGTDSLVLTVSSSTSGNGFIEYGLKSGIYSSKSAQFRFTKGIAKAVTISGLGSGTKIFYRLRYSFGSKIFLATKVASASTSKAGGSYIFAVQADPHMDENSSSEIYNKTLDLIAGSGASFLMDLGDIFMVDKLADKSEVNIRARYELMKGFYSRLKTVPLKITLGNHDGELGYSTFNTKKYRAEYFPEQTGQVSYFAMSEANAIHIALDPFTYTTSNPKADGWQWTLGKTQYDWLKTTLETSTAKFRYIYIHHLLVGDAQSRGGTKIAMFNEWGGKNQDGTYGFDQMRPGWYKPIHTLLKEQHVAIVFKGHDHLYVKEELDGIIYQTLPQPSHPGDGTNSAIGYGYGAGKVIGGSGYLKVSTTDAGATVDFVKYDGITADTYSISAPIF